PVPFQKKIVRSVALDFKMLYQYIIYPCDIPTRYFKASKPCFLTKISQEGIANGYEKYLTKLQVHAIDTDHFKILTMPHAKKIAAIINQDITTEMCDTNTTLTARKSL